MRPCSTWETAQWPQDPGRPRLAWLQDWRGGLGRRGELEGSGSQQLIEEIGCFYSEKLCLGVHGFVVCVVVGGVV